MAVVGRNPKYVDLLIKAGADVNQKNIIGDTPLHSATKRKSVECLKLLIDAGANVNIKHQDGGTQLMTAVFLENPIMVELLIKAGADVNCNNNGKTPLNYAAELESEECLKLLIEAGADVNSNKRNPLISSFGYKASVKEKKLEEEDEASLNRSRPLMNAACCGFTNSVKMLLAAGADMNAWNDEGYDALYFAADSSHYECVEILLKAGADVNNRTNLGEIALLAAVMERNTNYKEKDRVKTVNMLIKAGADVNTKNKREQTALFYASDYRCMNMLLEAGADVNITDYDGNNALHFLVNLDNDDKDYADYAKNYRQNVKRFLRAGIHINTINTSQGKMFSRYFCITSISTGIYIRQLMRSTTKTQ